MIGQAILGQTCAWCQLPATTSVEVHPAVYEKGEIVKASRHAPACDDHAAIAQRQGDAPPRNFRRRIDRDAVQLGLLDDGPGNAIRGLDG